MTRNERDDAQDRLYIVGTAVDDARSALVDRSDARRTLDRLIDVIAATIESN